MNIAIIGIVGVPGGYGGFETLADNLVQYHHKNGNLGDISVWCSGVDIQGGVNKYLSADLRYVNIKANGVQSIIYDIVSLTQAVMSNHDRIILLGVSGAIAIPILRIFTSVKIVTNVDGVEWKREKWNFFARKFLRISEFLAVRYSHQIISDNAGIHEHILKSYGRESHIVSYGGDHALAQEGDESLLPVCLNEPYALGLCRIEPENNVEMILEAFSDIKYPIIFVGNWNNSSYGVSLRNIFGKSKNITLLDPIYQPKALRALRSKASFYIHGHSAGGTNPSLVEMMHFGIPVLAYDCKFNRYTTEDKACYFRDVKDLCSKFNSMTDISARTIGLNMKEIADRRYTWDIIGKSYFEIMRSA